MPLSKFSAGSDGKGELRQLLLLYCLAEKLHIPKLADQTMDFMIGLCREKNWIPTIDSLAAIYGYTYTGSKLRLFAARCFAFLISHYDDKYSGGLWSNEKLFQNLKRHDDLLVDVLALLRMQAGRLQFHPRDQPACDYHQHAKTEACPYTKK
jgi:hypothetical protein